MIQLDQSILEQILELGGRLLMCGGESKRVESAIDHLCRAYGAVSSDVFVITSSITVTAHFEDREPLTQTKRITASAYNLNELNAINALSRELCGNPVPADKIAQKLSDVKPIRRSLPVKILIWAVVSAGFSVFFGGSLLDGLISALIGAVLCIARHFCARLEMGNHFSIIICSIIGGLLTTIPALLGVEYSQFYVGIGNIMLFIPGMALTNSIRDMMSGDTMTGLLRFIETLIISMAAACGFAVFDVISDTAGSTNEAAQLVTAFLGSLGLALIFNARIKNAMVGALCGFFGWGAVILCQALGGSELIGYFVASAAITLAAEILARFLHCPTTIFIVIAILPLVPGKSLYVTMQYAIAGNWDKFASQGIVTLLYAIAIATGIMFTSAIYDSAVRLSKKSK